MRLQQIQTLTDDSKQSLDFAIGEITTAIRRANAIKAILVQMKIGSTKNEALAAFCGSIVDSLESMVDLQLEPARTYIHGVRSFNPFPDEEIQPRLRSGWATKDGVVAAGGHEG